MHRQVIGWVLVTLLGTSSILPVMTEPLPDSFATRPYESDNTIGGSDSFSWTNLLSLAMSMFMPSTDVNKVGGSSAIQGEESGFNWMPLISAGMKLLLSFLGPSDSTDRIGANDAMQSMLVYGLTALFGIDNPQQAEIMAKQAQELIGIAVTLMDTLKTSFTRRSLQARSLGDSDPWSDAAVAGLSMLKAYTRTYMSDDDICKQKVICQGNQECVKDAGDYGYWFCQLGSYATSHIMEQTTYTPFDIFSDAGRRGRMGESCDEIFVQCNEV